MIGIPKQTKDMTEHRDRQSSKIRQKKEKKKIVKKVSLNLYYLSVVKFALYIR